jgi:hypothetical protein
MAQNKKKSKTLERICIPMEPGFWDHAKQIALQMSIKENRMVTPTEIVRAAIIERYPMSKKE